MPPTKQVGRNMKNNINGVLTQDCMDMSGAMETAACGIVASAMFDDSDRFSKTARTELQSASKSKRVRKA